MKYLFSLDLHISSVPTVVEYLLITFLGTGNSFHDDYLQVFTVLSFFIYFLSIFIYFFFLVYDIVSYLSLSGVIVDKSSLMDFWATASGDYFVVIR